MGWPEGGGDRGDDRKSDALAKSVADDARLVRTAQADPQAFGHLYDRYVGLVYRYCQRRTFDPVAAEDATSQVFLKALAALPRFDPAGGSFRSWLFAIAHNVVADQGRERLRRPQSPLEAAESVVDPAPSPEEEAERGERRLSVVAALALLTGEQRRVVELRLAGLGGPEIAAVLGRSEVAVRAMQRRALLRLRELLNVEDAASETGARGARERLT
ncbi:MAG: RNA polymerase sigma factor [Thermomicrobiales bacterium]